MIGKPQERAEHHNTIQHHSLFRELWVTRRLWSEEVRGYHDNQDDEVNTNGLSQESTIFSRSVATVGNGHLEHHLGGF